MAFGNDSGESCTDERAVFEIDAVRALLARFGGKELGFATDGESGYSWGLICELPANLTPDHLEGVLWSAWNAATSHRDLTRKGFNPAPLVLDPELRVLNWEAIRKGLESEEFNGVGDAFTGIQVNIARAVLERNGLL